VSVKPCTHTMGEPEPPRWLGVKVESKEGETLPTA
jgi:hypothetical protein